jgi:hypothetical protein
MPARFAATIVAALVAGVVAPLAPASTATYAAEARTSPAFAPAAVVVDPGCTYDQDYAQAAVDGSGVVHGFFNVDGNESFSCASPSTWRFAGHRLAWSAAKAPVAAQVMSVAVDTTGTYLLYASSTGIHLRKRWASGTVTDRRLSTRGLGTHIVPTGDVVARSGRWWAVWTENSLGSAGLGQTDLYQARTIGTDLARTRLTRSTSWSDADPQIALRPTSGAVLVWDRQEFAFGLTFQVMKATSSHGVWSIHRFTGAGTMNWLADVVVTKASTAITWTRDGSVLYADNAGGTWHVRSLGPGDASRIARSAGRTFVAYDDHGYVKLAVRGTDGTWSRALVTPLQGRFVHAVTAYNGRATVLYTDGIRLLARTQSS